jgi:hypothetical protein
METRLGDPAAIPERSRFNAFPWIAFCNGHRPHQALGDRPRWRAGVIGPLGPNAVDMMTTQERCPQAHSRNNKSKSRSSQRDRRQPRAASSFQLRIQVRGPTQQNCEPRTDCKILPRRPEADKSREKRPRHLSRAYVFCRPAGRRERAVQCHAAVARKINRLAVIAALNAPLPKRRNGRASGRCC